MNLIVTGVERVIDSLRHLVDLCLNEDVRIMLPKLFKRLAKTMHDMTCERRRIETRHSEKSNHERSCRIGSYETGWPCDQEIVKVVKVVKAGKAGKAGKYEEKIVKRGGCYARRHVLDKKVRAITRQLVSRPKEDESSRGTEGQDCAQSEGRALEQ